ncbi:hypothetical protein F4808DRAFT_273185 [Astrocystis sublimbata]|nr:hypothetical protein F4808DRAFT_273185 [Astrocystis sublimbata]
MPSSSTQKRISMSIYRLASREDSAAPVLSSGGLAAIAIVGSIVFSLIIVVVLIKLAKRQARRHENENPVADLATEHGQLSQDEKTRAPRKLRKRSVVSDGMLYSRSKDAESGSGGAIDRYAMGTERLARHLSLPHTLPPVFSRPMSFGAWDPFPGSGTITHGSIQHSDGGGDTTRPGTESGASDGHLLDSPEKRRGRSIYQSRRQTSWIDEDALHGPRVSSKKDSLKRRSSWLPGNGLTRTLSRHLSIRKFYAPELDRSPTLPFIENGPGRKVVIETPGESPEGRKNVATKEEAHRSRELVTESEKELHFPIRPVPSQVGFLNSPRIARVQNPGPQPQRASMLAAAPTRYRNPNNVSSDLAQQQLAARARVPSFAFGSNGQRYSQTQQRSTDADLQAILRRTAERLQDGNRSTRRQTMMVPGSSTPSRGADQSRRGQDSLAASPTKSQKSAPAVMLYAEPEDSTLSSKPQQEPSQERPAWQGHKRTRTQEISHIWRMSQASMVSEADSLVRTPSRRGSQADILQTALSSPSRSAKTSPSYIQTVIEPGSYSPASEQSSALSTVYSEEEGSPSGGKEMGKRVMSQALRTIDAFNGDHARHDNTGEEKRELPGIPQGNSHGFQPRHRRNGTLFPAGTQTAPSSPERRVDIEQAAPRFSLQALPSIQHFQSPPKPTEDPFTTSTTTPKRNTPQRLSVLFSPLPAKPKDDASGSSPEQMERGTPTRSPSHRRVLPPPHDLRPDMVSPTMSSYSYRDSQLQAQPPGSPVESEGGLSSVYDSYRYSRYTDAGEASQVLARASGAPVLTISPAESSPVSGAGAGAGGRRRSVSGGGSGNRWDQPPLSAVSPPEGYPNDSGVAFRSAHARLNDAISGAGSESYTHAASPSGPREMGNRSPPAVRFTLEEASPRSQRYRNVTNSTISCMSGESQYSQDEDNGDRLAPLLPIYSSGGAAVAGPSGAGKHPSRIMNAVAELRRMNSTVSCASNYSNATTVMTSPTLPALRGGGCSPGKKGSENGTKNYFALGVTPSAGNTQRELLSVESRRPDAGIVRVTEARNEINGKATAPVEISNDRTIGNGSTAVRNGFNGTLRQGQTGNPRSRRNTIMDSYERDLDRARQQFRESRGFNLQPGRGGPNFAGPSRPLINPVTK